MDSFELLKNKKGRMVEALTDEHKQENIRERQNPLYDEPKMSRVKNLQTIKKLSYDEKLNTYINSTEELFRFYTGIEEAPSAELAQFTGHF